MTSKAIVDLARLWLGDAQQSAQVWPDTLVMVSAVNAARRFVLAVRPDWILDGNGAVRTVSDVTLIGTGEGATVNLPDDALTPLAHYVAHFCYMIHAGEAENQALASMHLGLCVATAKGQALPTPTQ